MADSDQVKRYELVHLTQQIGQDDHEMQESPEGSYVLHSDYSSKCVELAEASKALRMARDEFISVRRHIKCGAREDLNGGMNICMNTAERINAILAEAGDEA